MSSRPTRTRGSRWPGDPRHCTASPPAGQSSLLEGHRTPSCRHCGLPSRLPCARDTRPTARPRTLEWREGKQRSSPNCPSLCCADKCCAGRARGPCRAGSVASRLTGCCRARTPRCRCCSPRAGTVAETRVPATGPPGKPGQLGSGAPAGLLSPPPGLQPQGFCPQLEPPTLSHPLPTPSSCLQNASSRDFKFWDGSDMPSMKRFRILSEVGGKRQQTFSFSLRAL